MTPRQTMISGRCPLRLRQILQDAGVQLVDLATHLGISRAAVSLLANHGIWPAAANEKNLEARITTFLADASCGSDECSTWHLHATPADDDTTNEDPSMLLRKQSITPQARRFFDLPSDPFADPQATDEVFLSSDIRYVRESMYGVARNGGFLAVVGESGSGKSTLREELNERLQRDATHVTVIEPYVLATEERDGVGKPLRSQHIAEAIMACVDPLAKTKSSPEARFRQLHESLRQSARAGHKHLLIFEEAHSLPKTTLKHLKRFMELKDGLRPLMSILLIAQPELLRTLSAANPEIREVMQRLEIVQLPPLDNNLEEYLTQRFKRTGVPLDKVFSRDAIGALRARLSPANAGPSMVYPLVVHNVLAAAMNRAVDLGVPQVTADVVRGV